MKLKRILALAAALVMLLTTLSGCSKDDETPGESEETKEKTKAVSVTAESETGTGETATTADDKPKAPDDGLNWAVAPDVEAQSIETFDNSYLSIYKKDGLSGIINISGRIVIEPEYTENEPLFFCPYHGLVIMNYSEYSRTVDDNYTIKGDGGHGGFSFSYIYDSAKKLLYMCTADEGGYSFETYTPEDNVIVAAQEYTDARDISEFSESYDLNINDYLGKYGLVGADGVVLDFEYDEATLSNGYAAVKKGDKYAYCTEKGEMVTDFVFDVANTAYKDEAWVKYNDKWGVVMLDW